ERWKKYLDEKQNNLGVEDLSKKKKDSFFGRKNNKPSATNQQKVVEKPNDESRAKSPNVKDNIPQPLDVVVKETQKESEKTLPEGTKEFVLSPNKDEEANQKKESLIEQAKAVKENRSKDLERRQSTNKEFVNNFDIEKAYQVALEMWET